MAELRQIAHGVRPSALDDGLGGAHSTAGGGLAGLHDRVSAVGGQLSLTNPAGQGTTIEAVMPCC